MLAKSNIHEPKNILNKVGYNPISYALATHHYILNIENYVMNKLHLCIKYNPIHILFWKISAFPNLLEGLIYIFAEMMCTFD